MMTLNDYTKIAVKIIKKNIGPRYLTDDNIGLVISYIVYADNNYDETKGSLRNFRQYSAKIALKQIVCAKKSETMSLSHVLYKYSSADNEHSRCDEITFEDVIEDDKTILSESVKKQEEKQKLVDEILSNPYITEREHDLLYDYFINGRTLKDIALDYNVTKQWISQSINKATNKLKDYYYVKN